MRRHLSFALLFLLVPCLAFGATATSTGSGKWSEAIWSGGAGDGGAPADGDAVVIAEGHSVLMDADLSGWTGITTLTITGSAASTPGMLYFNSRARYPKQAVVLQIVERLDDEFGYYLDEKY